VTKQDTPRSASTWWSRSSWTGHPVQRQLTRLCVPMTIRAALDELVRTATCRRHGRHLVTEPRSAQPLTLTSFSEDMRRGDGAGQPHADSPPPRPAPGWRPPPVPRRAPGPVKRLRPGDAQPIDGSPPYPKPWCRAHQGRPRDRSFYDCSERYGIVIASAPRASSPPDQRGKSEVLGSPCTRRLLVRAYDRLRLGADRRIRPLHLPRRPYRLVADLTPSGFATGVGGARARSTAQGGRTATTATARERPHQPVQG